jgi:hypothetical protein
MIRCTRSVCCASNARPVEELAVCCGAGPRDDVSRAQPLGNPTRIKIAIVRRILIVSPSSAQAGPVANSLSIVAKERKQLKTLSIQISPLDSDVIAIPKRPETIHI